MGGINSGAYKTNKEVSAYSVDIQIDERKYLSARRNVFTTQAILTAGLYYTASRYEIQVFVKFLIKC